MKDRKMMKRITLLMMMLLGVASLWAQNKVYTDDNGMMTMTKKGNVTMICKGSNGMVGEQISFPNEKGVAPMATTFNEKGLPASIISNGEKVSLAYGPDGHSVTATMINKNGEKAEYKVKVNADFSNYQAPGIFGMLDRGLEVISSDYGKQLKMAANVIDGIGNVVGTNWTTASAKDASWVKKLGGFLRSNQSQIAEQTLVGSGVTPVELFSDMKGYIEGGIGSGLIVSKTLLNVLGTYNEWKSKWSQFVYDQLDDMEFIDHLTPEEWIDTLVMTDEERAAFKAQKLAQWKEEQQRKLEANRKLIEEQHTDNTVKGQELIEGDRKMTHENHDGKLIKDVDSRK